MAGAFVKPKGIDINSHNPEADVNESSCGGKTLELRGCSRERYQEHKDVGLKDFNFNTNSEDRRLALCSQKEK